MSKIIFLLEDYNNFYSREIDVLFKKNKNYQEALNNLIARKHYQSDSMANAFRELGHETSVIIPEANPLQLQWAQEKNKILYLKWLLQKPIRSFKSRILKQYRTSYNSIQFDVLLQQIKKYKPDIIYFYSNIFITENQILRLKKYSKKIVLQWTCPIWKEQPNFPYQAFDLIITAAQQLKEYFEKKNYKTVYIQQAFDDSVVKLFDKRIDTKNDVVFIGGFNIGHHYRFEILEYLLQNNINLTIYGTGKDSLPINSMVYKCMKEPLYGIDMYNAYRKYKMAIHVYGTGNENDGINWNKYAGAKRLFEITGAGSMLLTSHQDNIKDLFEIDKEVVTFKNAEELLQKINYYLTHPLEAETIAKNGQLRTLKSHSFTARAKELVPVLFNSLVNEN